MIVYHRGEDGGDDVILCRITSQWIRDRYAIGIADADFTEGTPRKQGNVRPNRLFLPAAT
ncbi:MAG: hypothetical protein WCY70_04250 [Methanoculleus sp.]